MIDKKWQAFMAAYWEARNSGNSAEAERLVTEYYRPLPRIYGEGGVQP